jgi:MORN repeat
MNYEVLRPHIPKLEALWIGHTARNIATHLRRQTKPNHSYFSRPEILETLSKKVGMAQFRQKKKPYSYASGAVYTGQWCGGFRDGFGTMKWPDGASYEGNWSYSRPYGFGTFSHVDGDVYEGEWKIVFVSPKDTFGSGGNLNRWKDMVSDGYRNF